MKYRLEQTESGDMGSFVVVDRLTRLPNLTATEWLLRFSGTKAQNTIRNRGQDICVTLEWADLRSIDLNERLLSGRGFNVAELTDLAKFMGTSFQTNNHGQTAIIQVGARTHRRRVKTSFHYFKWILEGALLRLNIDDPRFDRMREKLKIIEGQLEALTPPTPSEDRTVAKGISSVARRRLFEIIAPGSKENPFPLELQLRNFVIIGLLFLLGLRLGELLALKFEDISFGHLTTIRVVKRRIDQDEKRKRPQKPKRGSRSLALAQGSLAMALATYINLRGMNQSCPFLISTESGNALTARAAQQIFEQLRDRFPDVFPANFNSHFGRHTMSAGLEQRMAKAAVPEPDRRKFLQAVRGDSCPESQDPYIYITIENEGNRHLLNYQLDLLQDSINDDLPF
jgi:integrase